MIRNYLKSGFRNLFRHKGYALINITGLAVGIASCLLISMYVKDEFTFDSYHENTESIYRLTRVSMRQGEEVIMPSVSYPEAEAYFKEIPEVINFARLRKDGGVVQVGQDLFDEKGILFTDKGLYSMFDFEVLDGALDSKVSELESLIITRSTAMKYFGNIRAAGKELAIKLRGEFEWYIVTAVIEDHPSNSSFNFNMAMSWARLKTVVDEWTRNFWLITPVTAYVMLDDQARTEQVAQKMTEVRTRKNASDDQMSAALKNESNGLIPLKEAHLQFKKESEANQPYLLSGIALLILIIASFNFSTLSIVNSLSRSKEVGVRKTIGASKRNLVLQFLTEALLISILSFILGIILAEVAQPGFESLVKRPFSYHLLDDPTLLALCFTIVLIICLLSVVYPSVFLSRLKVVNVFRGQTKVNQKKWLTRSMVTLQFLAAFVFITVAFGVNQQHEHLIDKEKGYNDQNLIKLEIPGGNSKQVSQQIKNELNKSPNILSVGAVGNLNEAISLQDDEGNSVFVTQGNADLDYLSTMQIELLEGSNFTAIDQVREDTESPIINVLINQSVASLLNEEDPIGKLIDNQYRVVGVVNDFQVFSALSKMNSAMLMADTRPGRAFQLNNIYIRYQENKLSETLSDLETVWSQVLPFEPFNYTFVDEYNRNLYQKESLWSKTLSYASGLAIVISIMGLVGLVGLSASERKKEVSIRKVLGATVSGLLLMLNRGVSSMLFLSIIISIPVAYYVIEQFLQDYTYRIGITPWLFAWPLAITFIVAFLIISVVTLRTASTNPVEALRNE